MLTVTYTPATDTYPSRLRVVHDSAHGKARWWVPIDYRVFNIEEQCRSIAQTLAVKRDDTVLGGYEVLSNRRPNGAAAKPRALWIFLLGRGMPMTR